QGGKVDPPRQLRAACPRYVLVDLHDDLSRLEADRERADPDVGIDRRDAGAQIERPAVPGARDHARLLEIALTERPALVRARVVDGQDRSLPVEDRQPVFVDLNDLAAAGRNLVRPTAA